MREGFNNIRADTASLVESQKQSRNCTIYKRSREDPDLLDTPLSVYLKMHDGLGDGHHVGPMWLLLTSHVATFPSPPFPGTLRDLDNMTLDDVKVLSMLMHTTFGIRARDRLEQRINKVRKHLLYRV